MYCFLAHFPQIDFKKINIIRRKYDANFPYIDPHIAVFFPVDVVIGETKLVNHVETIIKNWQPFQITLEGLIKSWDHYLYFLVNEGKSQLIKLHDDMYMGILKPYLFKDAGYTPYMTLGFFGDRQAKFDKSDLDTVTFYQDKYVAALNEAETLNMHYSLNFNKVTLIKRQDKHSPAEIVKELDL